MDNWNNMTNGYVSAAQAENELTLQRYVAGVMRKVFGKMTLGLLLTALTSFLLLSSNAALSFLVSRPIIYFGLFFVELGLVIYLSARIERLSTQVASMMFYLYSIITGITLTPLFLVYTGASIATTFAITAGTFGAMAIFGYVTRQDLTKIGSFLFMALIGVLLCWVVNILLLHSGTMMMLISAAFVFIFVGLTAWDTQMIKRMCAQADPSMLGKVATMGALSLYLDFINLFVHLLRIFGVSRD